MVRMKTLSNEAEWLENRDGIGGSDAGIVMGMNHYSTPTELFEVMTGRREPEDVSDLPSVQYGKGAEGPLRTLFQLAHPEMNIVYVPYNVWTNDKYPFAHASLDGWITDGAGKLEGVLEIKTARIDRWNISEWDNAIPPSYYCQVMHYLMVTEAEYAYLRAELRNPEGNSEIRDYFIRRNEDDIEELCREEKRFWSYVKADTYPPIRINFNE